jgi:hypothetical protein
LLIIGGSEIFTDQFMPDAGYMGQRPPHQDLILKALEGFALSEDLLHIRSKIIQSRFLQETSAFAKIMWRLFTILLAPAIVIGYGVFRAMARRDRRKAYRRLLDQATGGN